jgi:CubicO group peptidase (beta-lactamase class C family)
MTVPLRYLLKTSIVSSILALCCLPAQNLSAADPGSQLANEDQFSGAVLLAHDDTILLRAGYGLADREWNIPNTPTTKFRSASITKGFTAAAILLLQDEGKLSVKALICWYVANCPNAWQRITLDQLLTHTSGIPDYDSLPNYDTFRLHRVTLSDLIDFFRAEPLKFAPGTAWEYSNSGYVLLSQVIEKTSGESYLAFLKDHFFGPLGLNATGVEDMTSIVPGRARGYKSPTQLADYIDMTTESSAGQIYSTVEDLYR